jgi:hypothetical protein
MKKLILVAALLASFAAQAEDYCMELSGGARAVMHVRQIGLDARTQHDIADQTMLGDQATIMHGIIKDAYTQPVIANKAKAEQDFAVYWLVKCMKARNGFY